MALSNPSREDAERIGMELRRARKRHFGARNSLNRAAEIAGVSIALLSMIERGQHPLGKVRPETLERLPEAYGLKAQEFSDLTGITLVRPNEVSMGRDIFNIEQNMTDTYVQVRIELAMSGIRNSMPPYNLLLTSVLSEMAQRALGGLVMDKMYVNGIPAGYYALWSDRQADVGELVIVEHHGGQYPAFLLEGGFVVTDVNVDDDTTLRFLPDRIIGAVEEVRILTLPRRPLS